MRALAMLVGLAWILLSISGCDSNGSGQPAEISANPGQLASAQQTPAFRNLGKRGDSKL